MKTNTAVKLPSSLNALDENPVFHTQKISPDPVQVGSICLNSGDCRSEEGGSNRNLLDFNDLHIDLERELLVQRQSILVLKGI